MEDFYKRALATIIRFPPNTQLKTVGDVVKYVSTINSNSVCKSRINKDMEFM